MRIAEQRRRGDCRACRRPLFDGTDPRHAAPNPVWRRRFIQRKVRQGRAGRRINHAAPSGFAGAVWWASIAVGKDYATALQGLPNRIAQELRARLDAARCVQFFHECPVGVKTNQALSNCPLVRHLHRLFNTQAGARQKKNEDL
jgi:hypothetical protein